MNNRLLGIPVIIIGIYLIINSSKSIVFLWNESKKGEIAKENLLLEMKKNKELKQKLAEVKSRDYIEETARNKLGLSKKGEIIVILPEKIQVLKMENKKPEKEESNWKKWQKIFF